MTAETDRVGAELQSADRLREREYFRRPGGESGAGAPGRTGQEETSEALPPAKSPSVRASRTRVGEYTAGLGTGAFWRQRLAMR